MQKYKVDQIWRKKMWIYLDCYWVVSILWVLNMKISISLTNAYLWERQLVVHYSRNVIALHWFVQQESNNDNVLHYLCDFLFGGKTENKQFSNIQNAFKNLVNYGGPFIR